MEDEEYPLLDDEEISPLTVTIKNFIKCLLWFLVGCLIGILIFLIYTYFLHNVTTNLSTNKIILFGDSITENSWSKEVSGYGAQMADYYVRKQDVINRGLGDVTTQTALEKLISILLKDSQDLSLITIFLGSNDAVIYPPDFNSHLVELDKYIDNLRYMIVKIRDANADTKLILISPPPVDESRERLRKNSTTVNYKNACWDISMELSVPFLDTWELFKGKANELLFTDGLHLNKLGNDLVFKGLKDIIKKHWPEFSPEKLKEMYR